MRFRISKDWLIDFVDELLGEAGVEIDTRDTHEIEALIYESGGRSWDEDDDFYFIDWDMD